jgi:hypothetical protein
MNQQPSLQPGDIISYYIRGEPRYFLILKWIQNREILKSGKVAEFYKVWDLKQNKIYEHFFQLDTNLIYSIHR